jgi:hypothetical protein
MAKRKVLANARNITHIKLYLQSFWYLIGRAVGTFLAPSDALPALEINIILSCAGDYNEGWIGKWIYCTHTTRNYK